MEATRIELSRVGYADLRIEDVASEAGVNKTTIYRRWPTKTDLVRDAILQFQIRGDVLPDTGCLKSDLLAYFKNMIKMSKNDMWRGVLTTLTNRTDPAIDKLAHTLRREEQARRAKVVQRASDRGEIPAAVDPALIAEMIAAPIMRGLLTFNDRITARHVESVIDIVLAGVRATSRSK
jgi:AcrR family transcriptional regulator